MRYETAKGLETPERIKLKDGKTVDLVNYISGINRDNIKSCGDLPKINDKICTN